MMKKVLLMLFVLIHGIVQVHAQTEKWSFGTLAEIMLGDTKDRTNLGLQAKYDFSKRSAVQAQVLGRGDYVSIGADYFATVFDKTKSDFNIYLGGGVSQDFFGETTSSSILNPVLEAQNSTVVNGQVGISYYFSSVKLSLYSGYKLKYALNDDIPKQQTNLITIGLRYHMW